MQLLLICQDDTTVLFLNELTSSVSVYISSLTTVYKNIEFLLMH